VSADCLQTRNYEIRCKLNLWGKLSKWTKMSEAKFMQSCAMAVLFIY